MGRYYYGDIKGRMWFGVQDSYDPGFFGGDCGKRTELRYYFDESDLPSIAAGLARCEKELGEKRAALDEFFERNREYTDQELEDFLSVEKAELLRLLEWYARLFLGEEIERCVKEKGSCDFAAEL